MVEFEIKIPGNLTIVRDNLEKIGAEFIKRDYNKDIYFNHPSRDFAKTDEALRIRETSEKLIITYKGPKFDRRSKSRNEYNVEILNFGIVPILQQLGFQKVGIVEKYRELWNWKKINIALDKVEGLGEFIEIEIIGTEKNDLDKNIKELRDVARKLQLKYTDQITKSYLELLIDR